ncbi:MAG: sulfotransferase [Bacteroidia bacterium]|nr:sulfotransferase [Bacteroidia bacterium]
MDYKEINNIPMFFIVGRARSGTTLLQTMLDAHPSIIVPGESCVLMHLKNKYFKYKIWNNTMVDVFLKDLFQERKLNQFWNLNIEKIRTQIYQIPSDKRTFPLLMKIIYINYPSIFEQNKIKQIGDKNPIYTLFIKELIEIYPEAKFIHIVRDYRANIVSNRDTFSLKNIATLAHAWIYHNEKVESIKKNIPNKFLLLKYEDLISQPIKEMERICDFLKIEYHSSVLEYHLTLNQKIEDDISQQLKKTHGNLLQPINSNNIESWKTKLNKQDLLLSELIAGEYGTFYGYITAINEKFIEKNYIKSIYGNINNRFINFIIKTYYHSPFIFKKFSALFSKKMNDYFKIKNYYNQSDFG